MKKAMEKKPLNTFLTWVLTDAISVKGNFIILAFQVETAFKYAFAKHIIIKHDFKQEF